MLDLTDMENEWWIEDPEKYTSYENLPLKPKWLARCITDGEAKRLLEVYTHDQTHIFPEKYAVRLMLLSMQELSCIAESFSPATDPIMRTRLWRNVHFIWRLRESILIPQEIGSNGVHSLLERWVIRLIHGFSNSESERKEGAEELDALYSGYREIGKLEQGGVQDSYYF